MLVDLESSVIGQAGKGPIGPRLDILMRLSIAGGRPEVGYSLVPKGSLVKVKLLTPLSTVKARSGDAVKFEVVDDVVFEDRLVIPKGTPVTARVIDTLRPTKMGIKARIDLDIQPLDAIDSAPVVLGVEQATIAANSSVSLVAGEGIRVFGIVGKEGALGGLLSQNPELEIAEGVELFLSVMQTAKVLGLVCSGPNRRVSADILPWEGWGLPRVVHAGWAVQPLKWGAASGRGNLPRNGIICSTIIHDRLANPPEFDPDSG